MFRRETLVGFFGLITLFSVLYTVNYLRQNHYLDREIILYAKFKTTVGLLRTQPVRISGRMVGEVTRIFKDNPGDPYILVEMKLRKGTQVPRYAIASILDGSGIGLSASELFLEFSGTCEDDCCERGDTIMGREKRATDILGEETLSGTVLPLLDKLGNMDSVFLFIDDIRKTTERANSALAKLSPDLRSMVLDARKSTDKLAGQNSKISALLDTLASATGRISNQNLGKMLRDASASIVKINQQIAGLDPTLQKADGVIEKLDSSINKLMNNASLNKLLTFPGTADSLHAQIRSIDSLLVDLRLNPKKYLRLGKSRKIREVE